MTKQQPFPRIEFRTRLHDGIYASLGGGEWRIEEVFGIGPRLTVKAAKAFRERRRANVANYGSIGAGCTVAILVDERGTLDVSGTLDDLRQDLEAGLRTVRVDAKDWSTAPALRRLEAVLKEIDDAAMAEFAAEPRYEATPESLGEAA